MDILEALEQMRKEGLERAKGKKCFECKEFKSFGNVGVCILRQVPKFPKEDACQYFEEKKGE